MTEQPMKKTLGRQPTREEKGRDVRGRRAAGSLLGESSGSTALFSVGGKRMGEPRLKGGGLKTKWKKTEAAMSINAVSPDILLATARMPGCKSVGGRRDEEAPLNVVR